MGDDRYTRPVSRTIEPTTMDCERLEETVVRGGIRKN